jgi:serine/threonine protein phosphatase PrpC
MNHSKALPAGAATFCVIYMDGTKIKAANVGDSGFRVVRAGKVGRCRLTLSDPR